uniref:Dimer_Tnp_hAT domain-containing protein n=1 Tax=Caenorhabditis tropicalis TaxID=1561998 RepID=A0A1I7T2U2_9PELO
MTKFNIPLLHYTDILKMQILNSANVGINLYTRQHGKEILMSVAEKTRINLLIGLYYSNKPFSLMADSSTSKDSHQYLVVSIKGSFDGKLYNTYFYTVVELQREKSENLYSSIEKIVNDDSTTLFKAGYTVHEDTFKDWFWPNMIGFASDGGSSFAGHKEGLHGRLRKLKDERNEPFFYSICMSHRIDLASKEIDHPFRTFLTFLYSVTFRYFGSVKNKLLTERYRSIATIAGSEAVAIKTIFKVRWAASELSALDNLLRGGKWILKYLDHRITNEKVSKQEISRARVLESLRYVMADPRVFRAAVTWKLILEEIAGVSKFSQQEAAPISAVWPLLRNLENRLHREADWRTKEIQLLSDYGLRVNVKNSYKPMDQIHTLFGKSAVPLKLRFDSTETTEPKHFISMETRLSAWEFLTERKASSSESLSDNDKSKIIKESTITDFRTLADNEESFVKLMDYLKNDQIVLNTTPPGKAKKDTIVDRTISTTTMQPQPFNGTTKFDYLQFQALNPRLINDTINNGWDKVFTHSSWVTKFVPNDWFLSNDAIRKTAVLASVESIKSTFGLSSSFPDQYDKFMKLLPGCLRQDEIKEINEFPYLFWSTILSSSCIANSATELKKAIHYMLALPGSTAAVERSFSIVFHTRGPRRTRMKVDTLRAIMRQNVGNLENVDIRQFVEHWMRTNRPLAHAHPDYKRSNLYQFKYRMVHGSTPYYDPDLLEKYDYLDLEDFESWKDVPPLEMTAPSKVESHLSHHSDRWIVGSNQIKPKTTSS